MITSIRVENYRGIEKLEVKDFGRVNLIIGRNNSGKTALLEALGITEYPEDAGRIIAGDQQRRLPDIELSDFDNFWRPIFHDGNAEQGFQMAATHENGLEKSLTMRKTKTPSATRKARSSRAMVPHLGTWALEYTADLEKGDWKLIEGGPDGATFPEEQHPGVLDGTSWLPVGPVNEPTVVRLLSRLKLQNRDNSVGELLEKIDQQIGGLEIVSPTGTRASLSVRLKKGLMLPFRAMGEGVQRCIAISISLVGTEWPRLVIDEIEDGVHYSALKPLWRWIAQTSQQRGLQIFATTHSEECMQAAANAFKELDDDGLRVIRLDRREHETTASVYDRDLVLATAEMGVEIRE